jgi:hypothetical protein
VERLHRKIGGGMNSKNSTNSTNSKTLEKQKNKKTKKQKEKNEFLRVPFFYKLYYFLFATSRS